MVRKPSVRAKKHEILGGIKVSSQQLREWGSYGGRPKKWESEAERKRAERLRKKQERLGKEAQLAERKTYGEVKISKYLTCPNCGKVEQDSGKYFNDQGEYIKETYWFDTIKMEKTRIKENKFYCNKCFYSGSFYDGEVKIKEVKTVEKRAGSSRERVRRWREMRKKQLISW